MVESADPMALVVSKREERFPWCFIRTVANPRFLGDLYSQMDYKMLQQSVNQGGRVCNL